MSAGHGAVPSSKSERYRWTEFGHWYEDEFCEATDPQGEFESHSSSAYKEFHDQLKVAGLRAKGQSQADVAQKLRRPLDFVERWWPFEAKDMPAPAGVAAWQARRPEIWQDVTVVRGFARDRGIYDEVLGAFGSKPASGRGNLQWEQDWSVQKLRDGAQALRFDREGKQIPMGCMKAAGGYWGGCPKLDRTLAQFTTSFDLKDRHVAIMLLHYPSGHGGQGPHRHDCASAIISFGSPRILTVDGKPLLLRDGDLVLFGTQRHGVPVMPDIEGGRISLAFFYYPNGSPMPKGFSTSVADGAGADGPSETATHLQRERDLAENALVAERMRLNDHMGDVDTLAAMGFPRPRCAQILLACGLDAEAAAEALLAEAATRRRLQERLQALQDGPTTDAADVHAISMQLQEFEEEDLRCACIEAENAESDIEQEKEDAENWDGRGDLMVMTIRQRHMQIEMQSHATVGSIRAVGSLERVSRLMQREGVAVLYDLRPSPETSMPEELRGTAVQRYCAQYGVVFKSVRIGRAGTRSVERHLQSDEGRNALAELIWHGRRRRAMYLSDGEDRGQHQNAIASTLQSAGHSVRFFDGVVEETSSCNSRSIAHGDAAPIVVAQAAEPETIVSAEQPRGCENQLVAPRRNRFTRKSTEKSGVS